MTLLKISALLVLLQAASFNGTAVGAEGNDIAQVQAVGDGIKKTSVYEDSFLYVQVSELTPGTPDRLKKAVERSKNSKGLILDLRFAGGTNLAAASALADIFTSRQEVLLQVG